MSARTVGVVGAVIALSSLLSLAGGIAGRDAPRIITGVFGLLLAGIVLGVGRRSVADARVRADVVAVGFTALIALMVVSAVASGVQAAAISVAIFALGSAMILWLQGRR